MIQNTAQIGYAKSIIGFRVYQIHQCLCFLFKMFSHSVGGFGKNFDFRFYSCCVRIGVHENFRCVKQRLGPGGKHCHRSS